MIRYAVTSNVPSGDFAVAVLAYAVSKEIAYCQATKTIHNHFILNILIKCARVDL